MGFESSIEWTTHTFNLVWGCQRVSSGCQHCYAEALAKRYGHEVWGPRAPRRTMGEGYWKQPLRWNREARDSGQRARVFCSSMADVFEDHPTNNAERPRLWQVIRETPHLDWQLLTKRPENIAEMLPEAWEQGWRNVWLGTSVEDQHAAHRSSTLAAVPAAIRFLSVEPLIGALPNLPLEGIGWVIVGGESGAGARPMQPQWARSVMEQCVEAGVPCFFKQTGSILAKQYEIKGKGNHFEQLPNEFRTRQMPHHEPRTDPRAVAIEG